jgi:hypothetical protein
MPFDPWTLIGGVGVFVLGCIAATAIGAFVGIRRGWFRLP